MHQPNLFWGKLAVTEFADMNCSEEFLTGAQALFLFNSISESTDTGLY
jgi:hypothetical protein